MATAATAKTLPFLSTTTSQSSLRCQPPARRVPTSPLHAQHRAPAVASSLRLGGTRGTQAAQSVLPPRAAASYSAETAADGMCDPELRLVLELATDEELLEFEEILYGTSYFSPVIKSIAKRPNSVSVVALDDIEERDVFISKLESRFLYLAADLRRGSCISKLESRFLYLEIRRRHSLRRGPTWLRRGGPTPKRYPEGGCRRSLRRRRLRLCRRPEAVGVWRCSCSEMPAQL